MKLSEKQQIEAWKEARTIINVLKMSVDKKNEELIKINLLLLFQSVAKMTKAIETLQNKEEPK